MYVSILEQYFTQKGEAKGEARGEARGISIGEKKGISIGEKKGISIGEKKGISIGEARFSKETAMQMLSDGVPMENIVRWTKLPESEILKLKEKVKK